MPTRTRRRLREHTVGLLARKWTLRIAVTLSGDTKRHSELAKCLPGITQKVLTETLREMERTVHCEAVRFGVAKKRKFTTSPKARRQQH